MPSRGQPWGFSWVLCKHCLFRGWSASWAVTEYVVHTGLSMWAGQHPEAQRGIFPAGQSISGMQVLMDWPTKGQWKRQLMWLFSVVSDEISLKWMALAGLPLAPQMTPRIFAPSSEIGPFLTLCGSISLYVIVNCPAYFLTPVHCLRQGLAVQILLITCFCIDHKLKIFFYIFLNWQKNSKKNNLLWHIKIMWNSYFSVHAHLQQRPCGLRRLMYLLFSPLQKKFATTVESQWLSNILDHDPQEYIIHPSQ